MRHRDILDLIMVIFFDDNLEYDAHVCREIGNLSIKGISEHQQQLKICVKKLFVIYAQNEQSYHLM